MRRHTLFSVFVACGWVMLLAGCSWLQPLEEPDIQVVGLKMLPSDNPLAQDFELQLRVSNPNDRRLDVKGIIIDFALDDVELLHGQSRAIPVIEPYGQADFTLEGSANIMHAARLLMQALKAGPDERFEYVLKARIDLRHQWPSTFHITRDGEIDLGKSMRRKSRPWDT